MSLTIYGTSRSRAFRVLWMAEELGLRQAALDEYRAADAAKHLNSTQKLAALEKEIDDTLKKIVSGQLSQIELDEQHKHLIDVQGQIADENDARKQREIDKERSSGCSCKQRQREAHKSASSRHAAEGDGQSVHAERRR